MDSKRVNHLLNELTSENETVVHHLCDNDVLEDDELVPLLKDASQTGFDEEKRQRLTADDAEVSMYDQLVDHGYANEIKTSVIEIISKGNDEEAAEKVASIFDDLDDNVLGIVVLNLQKEGYELDLPGYPL